MTDYFQRDYDELKDTENKIYGDIKKRKDITSKSENTTRMEQQLYLDIDIFGKKVDSALKAYKARYHSQSGFSETEITKRIKMLTDLNQAYFNQKKAYDAIINEKYDHRYNMDKYENYADREEFQNKDSKQIFDTHKDKLKNQDEQIGELVGVAKQGNKLAVNLGSDLKDQNVKLDYLDKEIENRK